MVSQDKSMEAMIQNEEKEWMQPLLDIRNDLDVQDDRDRRDFRRLVAMSNFSSAMWMAKFPLNRFLALILRMAGNMAQRVLTAQTEIRRTGPVEVRDITQSPRRT